MKNKLFKSIDNSALIVFRIFFGFLLAAETFGAIFTGWVRNVLIEPQFTFSHIGFEWLQPLPGNWMYVYFMVMGVLGVFVMVGYKYKWSLGTFTVLWTAVYLMQKSSYNNHYYLLILVCIVMLFLPANRYASIDVKQKPEIKMLSMPQWCAVVMIVQVAIMYFFATIAKFYPEWMDGTFTRNLFANKTHFPIVGFLFTKKWFYIFIAYTGILFDLLIVPLLLWKRTRTIALICALIFHLFNALVLQIGIFPFFALSFTLFFYPPEKIRSLFLRKKPTIENQNIEKNYNGKYILYYFFIPFFIIQLLLPIRHYFIKGDVFWTEEGHRLSWRMMLRSRSGYISYIIVDNATEKKTVYDLKKELTHKQIVFISGKPDGMWQMAQHIKKKYEKEGKDVSIYIHSQVSVNGSPFKTFVDPKVDFAKVKWNYFSHNDWIILYE